MGTKDGDDGNNTKIVLSGFQRGGGNGGNIEYLTAPSGANIYLKQQIVQLK